MTRLRLLAVVVVLAILTISTGVVMAAPPQQDPAPDVTFSESAVTVMEPAGTTTYTVVYNAAPTADVTMTVTSSHPTINAMVSPASLTFTTTNWNVAQTVTVTAVDDDVDHVPNRMATIAHVVDSSRPPMSRSRSWTMRV